MTLYSCSICTYTSKIKCNYFKHLKTVKHIRNLKGLTPNPPKPSNSLQNPPISSSSIQKYNCQYCNRYFTRQDNLKRHEEQRCKKNDHQLRSKDKQIEELKLQVELLLTKVGHTTTNIQTQNNTININNFGNEDMSHITSNMKTELLKIPYGMIPKLVQEVHFNKDKPENWNLMLVNKSDGYVKVYNNNKWHFRDKNETIRDLVDGKYCILDEHYESTQGEGLNKFQDNNYNSFRNKMDSNDKELHNQMKKQCELTILNNRNE
jgi:hypothetical protein